MSGCCPLCGGALALDRVYLDSDSGIVASAGRFASLTQTELSLFEALYGAPGRVISKDKLFKALYWRRNDAEEPDPKIIDILICKLRRKLDGMDLDIETVWGSGYRMKFSSTVPARSVS